ncbi:MAG: hypothetical protein R3284_10860, partial [Rubricoccaceae bacterium]|nr:hypothetical protein [Rubricoccaceae bacterium]
MLITPIAFAQGSGCSFGDNQPFLALDCVSTILSSTLQWIQNIQSRMFDLALAAIRLVAGWQVDVNNEIVFGVWEILRDFANIFFIVGLVVISFATIFRATGLGFFRNWHYQSALPWLLGAAILVNFSLGISDVVVRTANRVTVLFVNIADSANLNLADLHISQLSVAEDKLVS